MRFCRYQSPEGPHYGIIETYGGREVITPVHDPFADEIEKASQIHFPFKEAMLLAPVCPSKIICVGRNYREHARELGNPVPTELLTFFKPPSAVTGPGQDVVRPAISQRVDYEGELAVVIGRRCRNLRADEDVRRYIRGYTCLNDVTARDIQKKDAQWTRGKGFDTFCPVGPVVSDAPDPWKGVQVQTRVNGQLRQDGNTRDLIFPLDEIIRHIARVMTLFPGDLIATGTPEGVGELKAGDVVEVAVEGVGALRNPVVDEKMA